MTHPGKSGTDPVDPYASPGSRVEDAAPRKRGGWLRLCLVVIGFSALTLILTAGIVPYIAYYFFPFTNDRATMTPFLVVNLALSTLCFFACVLFAASRSGGRPYASAFGVTFIAWATYFSSMGGFAGVLETSYPMWYELFPSQLAPGVLAGFVAARRAR